MSDEILLRNVPKEIRTWIDDERHRRQMSLAEFIIAALGRVKSNAGMPTLFDSVRLPMILPAPESMHFRFIDLFAGIGGFRLGLSRVGGECVFTSEWDQNSQKTYRAWHGEQPHGDITKIPPREIPDHDLLAAGFPCQPFSIAGVSKKNSLGRAHGFKDLTQGTLFYNIVAIAEEKRPSVLVLENVKNLLSHDKRRTWQVIKGTLEDLQYIVFHKIIDAAAYVPQHRERVFIVAFDRKKFGKSPPFQFPEPPVKAAPKLREILDPNPPAKYTLTDHLWKYLQNYAKRHAEKGNGFGFGIADPDGVTRTLSARYYKDGSEILIAQGEKNPRRLTPRECARLLGYPDDFPIIVSDTQAYRQFGNSLVPAVAEAVAKEVIKVMHWWLRQRDNGCLVNRRNSGAARQKQPALLAV